MQQMPEKDPGVWLMAMAALREHGLAAVLAFALSYVRIVYDGSERRPLRQLTEATLGGLIAVAVGLTCEEFGFSSGWSYFSAFFVGLMGVDQVRAWASKWAERRAETGKL